MEHLEPDPRLRAALRHAPDGAAQPSAALRASILAAAGDAVPVPAAAAVTRRPGGTPGWPIAVWGWLMGPPGARPLRLGASGALASVLLAGVIGLIWRDAAQDLGAPGAPDVAARSAAATADAPAVQEAARSAVAQTLPAPAARQVEAHQSSAPAAPAAEAPATALKSQPIELLAQARSPAPASAETPMPAPAAAPAAPPPAPPAPIAPMAPVAALQAAADAPAAGRPGARATANDTREDHQTVTTPGRPERAVAARLALAAPAAPPLRTARAPWDIALRPVAASSAGLAWQAIGADGGPRVAERAALLALATAADGLWKPAPSFQRAAGEEEIVLLQGNTVLGHLGRGSLRLWWCDATGACQVAPLPAPPAQPSGAAETQADADAPGAAARIERAWRSLTR